MSKSPPPSPRQTRDAAEAALAAGNPIASVAKVFGVPIETLQDWIRQRPEDVPGEPWREPERAWLSFPGSAVYPTGLGAGVLPAAGLIAFAATAWSFARFMPHRWEFLAGLLAFTAGCIGWAVYLVRSARVERFEMRPYEIARYDMSGCIVLPYSEIIGLAAGLPIGMEAGIPGNEMPVWTINFLTSTGKSMTIYPRFEQLDDERLWQWLKAIPQRSGPTLCRMADMPYA